MSQTPRLGLPYLQPNQAQKHVTLNESLRRLDLLVQTSAQSRAIIEPPALPEGGGCWIVPATATGAWEGYADHLAAWQDGDWVFIAPVPGMRVHLQDEDVLIVWSPAGWHEANATPEALQMLTLLGLGTMAGADNPFAAKLNKALWTARPVSESGDGDLRYTLNKETAGNVLSLLMQSGWEGRAEIGLIGNDDLTVKVSPDGEVWREAVSIDRSSGQVSFPQGISHGPSGAAPAQLILTPGGDGEVSFVRFERSRTADPRTASLAAVSADILTLVNPDADFFFTNYMRSVSWVRIWNTSRPSPEAAWACWNPAADQLQVTRAEDIAAWAPGDMIQLGDQSGWPGVPTGFTRGFALDISPMMQNRLGAVFRQKGVMFKCTVFGDGANTGMVASPDARPGSFQGGNSLSNGLPNTTQHTVPTTVLSPVSNSNLIWVREDGAPGSLSIATLMAVGVWV